MSSLEIFETLEQGSEEWRRLRAGLPTASEFKNIMAVSAERTMRTDYMRRLAAEILTGEPIEGFSGNNDTKRGHEQEDSARRGYCFITDAEVKQIGFARDLEKGAGASPDGLIGDDGGLEIKSMRADLLVGVIDADVFPSTHYWQVMGNMWITGRRWWDIAIYAPKMRLFTKRLERDPEKCAALAKEVRLFNSETAALVARIRSYGGGAT